MSAYYRNRRKSVKANLYNRRDNMGKKYSYSDVKYFLESNGLKLLSDKYKNNKEKLEVECSCGEVFFRSFQDIKNKNLTKCPCCTGNKLSYKNVADYIKSKGCTLVSKTYERNCDKLDIKCECGNIYKVDFNTFKKGQTRCKSCYWKIKNHHNLHDYGYVKKYIETKSDSILLSDEYKGCFNPLKIKCSCGEVWITNFYKIQKSQNIKCKSCLSKIMSDIRRHDWEQVEEEVSKIIHNKFSIVKCDYKNIKTDINLKCIRCGYEFKRSIANIRFAKSGCPFCERSNRLKTIEEAQVIIDSYADGYKVVRYDNVSSVYVKHEKCGHISKKRLSTIRANHGIRCELCNPLDSVGVVKIKSWLDKNHIKYKREKTFNGCVYQRKLFFDFYLPDYNTCIEFDGQQHFKPTLKFGGEKNFRKYQIRDNIKNKYCKDNNINLLRIKYDEINKIDTILEEYFTKC